MSSDWSLFLLNTVGGEDVVDMSTNKIVMLLYTSVLLSTAPPITGYY